MPRSFRPNANIRELTQVLFFLFSAGWWFLRFLFLIRPLCLISDSPFMSYFGSFLYVLFRMHILHVLFLEYTPEASVLWAVQCEVTLALSLTSNPNPNPYPKPYPYQGHFKWPLPRRFAPCVAPCLALAWLGLAWLGLAWLCRSLCLALSMPCLCLYLVEALFLSRPNVILSLSLTLILNPRCERGWRFHTV
jgi:hypothetical protein